METSDTLPSPLFSRSIRGVISYPFFLLFTVWIAQHAAAQPLAPIQNPYHREQIWKNWAEDPAPVSVPGADRSPLAPAPPEQRWYPVFEESGTPPRFERMETPPESAGYWDDVYMSLDHGHSNLRLGNRGMMMAPKMRQDSQAVTALRLRLGVNFTSQSYAKRGRHIVDDQANILKTEATFTFANAIRATPAHASFRDNNPEQVQDDYDALYSHVYQSVGQSSSEIPALQKFALAGACMPRQTKDLLKRHGLYAPVLLTLFRAALPYADADGNPVPYAHPLRHRSAYTSHGDVNHPHWCSANLHYHGYNERLHSATMAEMARDLKIPPPVTLMKIESLTVKKDGEILRDRVTGDARVKTLSHTHLRIWGNPGETLTLIVDLSPTIDLSQRELTFFCQPLHTNHDNLSVKPLGSGRFEVTARHNPDLPKGRLPVIAYAENGTEVPGSPVFLNFYWPDEQEQPDQFHFNLRSLPANQREQVEAEIKKQGWKVFPVTVNKRPALLSGETFRTLRCAPGDTVTFPVGATDPEGFPVRIHRRLGEPGGISDGKCTVEVPADTEPGLIPLHFLYLDGTGGNHAERVTLMVENEPDRLNDGWFIAPQGNADRAAVVRMDGDRIIFGPAPENNADEPPHGTLVYRKTEGDFDVVLDVGKHTSGVFSLIAKNGLEKHQPYVRSTVLGDKTLTQFRSGFSNWGMTKSTFQPDPPASPRYLRITRRGEWCGMYSSSDGALWQLVLNRKFAENRVMLGVLFHGAENGAGCVLRTPDVPLPLLANDITSSGRNQPQAPVTLTAPLLPGGGSVNLWRSGDPPGGTNSLTLTEAGTHHLLLRSGDMPAVQFRIEIAAPGK